MGDQHHLNDPHATMEGMIEDVDQDHVIVLGIVEDHEAGHATAAVVEVDEVCSVLNICLFLKHIY